MEISNVCKDFLSNISQRNGQIWGEIANEIELKNFLGALSDEGYDYFKRTSKKANNVPCTEHDYHINTSNERRIKFSICGTPFFNGRTSFLKCVHGRSVRRNVASPTKVLISRSQRNRSKINKIGCKSSIIISERHMCIDECFKTRGGVLSKAKKKLIADNLRAIALSGGKPETVERYFIKVSPLHNHPPSSCKLHPKLSERIEQLVGLGITGINEIQQLLLEKVNDLFNNNLPSKDNLRYYPKRSTIHNLVCKVLSQGNNVKDSTAPLPRENYGTWRDFVPSPSEQVVDGDVYIVEYLEESNTDVLTSTNKANGSHSFQTEALQNLLRNKCKEIVDLSYKVNDTNALLHIITCLESCLDSNRNTVDKDLPTSKLSRQRKKIV